MTGNHEVLMKATPLRSLLSLMNAELGRERADRLVEQLAREFPSDTGRLRGHMPIVSDRFPVAMVNRLIELAANELGEPPSSFAHRVGRRGAEDASTGVMKLAMTILSVPALLRKLSPVWSQLYTHGVMHNRFEGNGGEVELTDFPMISPIVCARVTGNLEWFGQKAEKSFRIEHVECRAEGGTRERWTIRW